jgi:hypothetical protein
LREASEGDPFLGAKPLRGELRTLYRYRVAKWRIIVDIRRRELVVLVLDGGRRDKIYGWAATRSERKKDDQFRERRHDFLPGDVLKEVPIHSPLFEARGTWSRYGTAQSCRQ